MRPNYHNFIRNSEISFSFQRILNIKVLCACLICIAFADGWIFTIRCSITGWPSNWEHGSAGPTNDKTIYGCDVTVGRSGNLTSLVDVIGNHLEGKTNSDIELIRIDNSSTFTSIPSNIGNLLPNLLGIDIRDELMTSVTAEDLKQFPNLTYLSICACPIVSLDGDLFKYTPHIQALLIPSNKIVNVGLDLLTNLVDLKFVNFLSNPCLSYYASNPQQLEFLKNNLPSRCPPIITTTLIPSPNTPSSPNTPPTSTVPVEDCEVRCSLNDEIDELKDQLNQQGTLIRDLMEIVEIYSLRIYELEKFDAKVISAVSTFST